MLLAGLAGCSPFGSTGAFQCQTDSQCVGGPGAGQCHLDTGFCAFMDSSCPTGERYGSSSGAYSDRCVGDDPAIDASVIDSPVTTDGDPGIDARQCFGDPLQICLTVLPSGPRTLPATINTDNDCDQLQAQSGGPELCVVTGGAITINTTRATGARPLVIVATQTITVNGSLDVSSPRGMNTGAGGNATACLVAGTGTADSGGGAGGGGGGFGADGGDAGKGDTNNSGGGDGDSAGGNGSAMLISTFVRGGCRGGVGGDGPSNNNGGAGGNGGGAVYLIAGTSISVSGSVFAAGGGGTGGQDQAGGGGGGSGGLIGFDAPSINVTGIVAANGGGGGGGGGNNSGGNGANGTTTMYDQLAAAGVGGGQTPAQDTPGGRGGALGTPAGEDSPSSIGGSGGGGGGVGVVWTHGTVSGNQISPAPTPH